MAKIKVCLDPGHGASDSGAAANGIVEKDINMKVALAVRTMLKARGFDVVMTRTSNTNFAPGVTPGNAITSRGRFSVAQGSDVFVSIHHDSSSGSARGCSSFYYNANCTNAKALATAITTRLHDRLGLRYAYGSPARVHWVSLGVLRGGDNWRHVTACLVECAMLTSTGDAAMVKSPTYVSNVASCIVDGIAAHVGAAVSNPQEIKVVLDGKVIECDAELVSDTTWVDAAKLFEALGITSTTKGRKKLRDLFPELAVAGWKAVYRKYADGRQRVYVKRLV